jgi:hypothetical protein
MTSASRLLRDYLAPSLFVLPNLLTSFRQHLTPGKCCFSTHASCHATAMLTRPDRQKFEQIRARWEAAQQDEEETTNMVGRKVPQQPVNGDAHASGGSKFRRTLSHGLALISNPLSQRKTTPGRQPAHNPVLAVVAPPEIGFARQYDALPSPTCNPSPVDISTSVDTGPTSLHHESPIKSPFLAETPKTLPRSRTTSFLPRPVKFESDTSATDLARTTRLQSPPTTTDHELRTIPSKIPTPSPPLSERRGSSPRQYLPRHTILQATHALAGHVFAGAGAGSPSKTTMRSHTTPSLVKAANLLQAPNYMAPRNTAPKRHSFSPSAQKPVLQENIPSHNRLSQRHSQLQGKALRRESLAVPTTNPRSSVQGSPLAHSKQPTQSTPLTAKKRLSSNLAQQTPITAVKRVQSDEKVIDAQESTPTTRLDPIAPSRLMGPQDPPTPTPLPGEVGRPALPRSNTDKDLQRKTLGTPNGLGGVWRSSRALAAANHEVRRLPRSSTFHNFGGIRDDPPPVPPIPYQYRTPSLSSFLERSINPCGPRTKPHRATMVSNAPSCESIPEEMRQETEFAGSSTSYETEQIRYTFNELVDSSDDPTARLPLPRQMLSTPNLPPIQPETFPMYSPSERPWSISERQCEDSADVEPHLQVRDYMPPLYWAGRFTSRFDHWRTEAMIAELDPRHRTEDQLGQCKLHEKNAAACYIFAQMRDLCLTGQAADSLWVRRVCLPVFHKC